MTTTDTPARPQLVSPLPALVVPRQPATSRAILLLSSLVAVLAAVAAGSGLFSAGGSGDGMVRTVHGEAVQMFGHGLYRYDTLFQAAIFKGSDAAVLFLGIPLLVLTIALSRRGTLRGSLLLLATLAYFLYTYVSLAVGAAYNDLYLVYVALFGASLLAFVALLRAVSPWLAASLSPRIPRRGLAAFLFVAGGVTAVIWLSDLLGVSQGQVPKHLDSYTTMTTYVLDLGIITPACMVSGLLVLRHVPLGYLMAVPLLGIVVLLVPTIPAQTVSQLVVGVSLTPGEIVGPVVGFVALGLIAIALFVNLLRHLNDGAARFPVHH